MPLTGQIYGSFWEADVHTYWDATFESAAHTGAGASAQAQWLASADPISGHLHDASVNRFTGTLSVAIDPSLPDLSLFVNGDVFARIITQGPGASQGHDDASLLFAATSVQFFDAQQNDITASVGYAWVNGTMVNPAGASEANPLVAQLRAGQYDFTGGTSGFWHDPPTASAFDYVANSSSTLFAGVGLPTGFGTFTIYYGSGFGSLLGTFASGQLVNFLDYTTDPTITAAGGLSAFRVAGNSPAADAPDRAGFPTQLFFTHATGNDLTVTPQVATPEPATWLLVVRGLAGLVGLAHCRRQVTWSPKSDRRLTTASQLTPSERRRPGQSLGRRM